MRVANVEKRASYMERLCAIHVISDLIMVREDNWSQLFTLDYPVLYDL